MQRFLALAPADQLRAYERMREYLGAAAKETKADREIRERIEALDAIGLVARRLELPAGKAPSAGDFNSTARQVAPAWNTTRVGRAWETWRFACEIYTGKRPRPSARQSSLRSTYSGRRRSAEEPLTALRLWLATSPPRERGLDYDRWADERNASRREGDLAMPRIKSICATLLIEWAEMMRVAKGEITAEEGRLRTFKHRTDFNRGPHEFVSTGWIAHRFGLSSEQAGVLTHKPDFPRHVLTLGVTRVWLRDDVEAFARGREVPVRRPNELQHLYLGTVEVGRLLGVRPSSLHNPAVIAPELTGRVGSKWYWLRAEVEQWLREHPREGNRRSRVRAAKPPG
ncbi:MAG: hypothetical protein WKF41_04125 [Gaiellaceae bacterium]